MKIPFLEFWQRRGIRTKSLSIMFIVAAVPLSILMVVSGFTTRDVINVAKSELDATTAAVVENSFAQGMLMSGITYLFGLFLFSIHSFISSCNLLIFIQICKFIFQIFSINHKIISSPI